MAQRARPLQLAALAVLACACLLPSHVTAKGERPAQPRAIRVLFVGNSYTYVNDLPYVVAVVAAARGVEVEYGMLAEPNFALEDHIVTGAFDAKLAEGWDWVVLQQGPSSLPQNREHLRVWSERAAASARARRTSVVLFSAWPARGNAFTWLDAEESYRLAARAVRGCIAPIATAWRYARAGLPSLDVYAEDGLHASEAGTLLAAQVIVRAFLERRFSRDPPALAGAFEQSWWQPVLAQSDALDAFARRAVADMQPRCAVAKHAPGGELR